jgi:ABC-type polysaccharide/polyol phosphate transport system ATPase subunit
LLRIAGIDMRPPDEDSRVTVAAAGQVLDDISFDVEQGSVVCLTGPSGSGKTVLLQILAGALPPTIGSVEFYGPVTSLLALGDNLDPQRTAHENIQASDYVLDGSPDEAARSIAEVIEFAGLQGFEHVAIRTYSTGMVLRLSVALALCGHPSIVLIDDVLSVGDIGFQQQCVDRVLALKEAGCTLVLAFSDEALVQRLATRVIALGGGRIVSDTPPVHWVATRRRGGAADVEWHVLQSLPEDDWMALRSIAVEAHRDAEGPFLEVRATFEVKADGLHCRPLIVVAAAGQAKALFRSLYPEFVQLHGLGARVFSVRVPVHILPDGDYTIGLHIVGSSTGARAMKASHAVSVTVRRQEDPEAEGDSKPMLLLPLAWEIERVVEAQA